MYNDTWGEVGWTIIDYYLDRKPSFYYVKRAFAPVKFILRASEDGKAVRVMGINDTPEDVRLELEYGYVSFEGKYETEKVPLTLGSFSKAIVREFAMPSGDTSRGLVFARGGEAPLAILRTGPFRNYQRAESGVSVLNLETAGGDYRVTLKSSGYSHAVSLGLPGDIRLDDEYFDMLPGEVRTITIRNASGRVETSAIRAACLVPGKYRD
jgi:beta-mannosidase